MYKFTVAVHLVETAIPSDQIAMLTTIHYTHQCYDSIHPYHHRLSPWQYLKKHYTLRGNILSGPSLWISICTAVQARITCNWALSLPEHALQASKCSV